MTNYEGQIKMLVAVDCIVFGFDGRHLKLLLIQRDFVPEAGKWSLMGGFVQKGETLSQAAGSVLKTLTGLSDIYLEELASFSEPARDPVERTLSVAFVALIDIAKYQSQITDNYRAEWFPLHQYPPLIFDHTLMVEKAKDRLRYKACIHPILFELLPEKFTIPQLQNLYEQLFHITMDNRNFSRKILSLNLLIKLNEKEKQSSKKGAWFYKLNKRTYRSNFHLISKIIPATVSYLS